MQCTYKNASNSYPLAFKTEDTEKAFYNICGFPGVIGAIDESYIAIKALTQQPENILTEKIFTL